MPDGDRVGHKAPTVLVCAGGGGVGKTTSSAALGLALARRGSRVLVVTVDPARRLAQAMGIDIDTEVHPAHVEPRVDGKLFALMPEPRAAALTFIRVLFEAHPEALARVLANPVYVTMGDALAGIHELVSLMLVARAVRSSSYDYLVVDTAPSRNALEFIAYPGRLAQLLEGRAMSWIGNLAQKAASQETAAYGHNPPSDDGGLLAWGRKRVEAAVSRVLNPTMTRNLTQLFADLSIVRDDFAGLARVSEELLLGPNAKYLLVAAPTGSACADVEYLSERLAKLGKRPIGLLLNRADPKPPSWTATLREASQNAALRGALAHIEGESAARKRAADELDRALSESMAGVRRVRLPTVEAREPSHIVRALADALEGELSRLGFPAV